MAEPSPADAAAVPPKRFPIAGTIVASVALLAAGGLFAFGWIQDPSGRDARTLIQNRIVGGSAAFILFFVAAGLTAKARPRFAAAYRGLAILGAIGAVDAVLLLIHIDEWIRNLVFLLGGLLLVALVLGQLRKRRSGDVTDALDFFARNWAYVAFLLFLIIARVGADQPLKTLMPSLLVNAFFLLAFLSALFALVYRYLRAFGSPVSWNEAKHHEQDVQALRDPEMEGIRDLLHAFVERGERYEPYQTLVRDLAVRNETPSDVLEPLLARPPAPLSGGVPAAPTALRIGASVLVSVSAAFPIMALFWIRADMGTISLYALAAAAFFAPMVDGALRPRVDRASATLWAASGVVAGGALFPALRSFGAVGLAPLGAIVLLHGGMALRALLTARPKGPAPAAILKLEGGQEQRRRALRLVWTGGAAIALLLAYLGARPTLERTLQLPDVPLPFLLGIIGGGLGFAAAGYLLGPFLRAHREVIRTIHEQEKSQRTAFHLHVVQLLEGTHA